MRNFVILLLWIVIAIWLLGVIGVFAHEAPKGWTYPMACCSNQDCREVDDVAETTRGYRVPSGEVIPYSDTRVMDSPDGEYHWCANHNRTLCLFAPPRSF